MFDTGLTLNDLWFMMKGAGVTLAITFFAVTGGTVMGVAFGVIRSHVKPWVTLPLVFVLDIFRSVPLLIQLILANAFQAIAGLADLAVHHVLHRAGAIHLGLLHRDRARRDRRGADWSRAAPHVRWG